MFSFRTLKNELSGAAGAIERGAHDFQKPSISAYHTHHEFVFTHENIHDEILVKTPFGGLQYLCTELRNAKLSNTPSLDPPPQELFELLCDFSEEAHEAAATYLSITSQPVGLHQDLLRQHDHNYQNFYMLLSQPVDLIARCSYIQFIIARQMVDVIFAPPLAAAIETWVGGEPLRFLDWQKPSARLTQLTRIISEHAPQLQRELEIKTNNSAARLITPGDDYWNSEAWWETAPTKLARELEAILCAVTFATLRAASAPAFPTIDPEAWRNECERYLAATQNVFPDARGARAITNATGSGIIRPTVNVVANPNAPSTTQRAAWRKLTDLREVFSTRGKPTAFLRDSVIPDPNNPDWIRCVVLPNDDGIVADRCPDALLKQALDVIRATALMGAPTLELPPLISPASNFEQFVLTHNERVSTVVQPLSDGVLDFGTQSLFWYLIGDFAEWLHVIQEFGESDLLFTVDAEFQSHSKEIFGEVPENVARRAPEELLARLWKPGAMEDARRTISTKGFDKVPSLFFVKNERVSGYFIKLVPFWLVGEYVNIVVKGFPKIRVGVDSLKLISANERSRLISITPTIAKATVSLWENI